MPTPDSVAAGPARLQSRRFRPGWPLTLAVLVALSLLMALGTWQVQRLHWKLDLIARTEAGLGAAPVPLPVDPAAMAALDLRPVTATGTLLADRAFAFRTEQQGGVPGARLMLPLVREAGAPLLVDMGWIPEPIERTLEAPPKSGTTTLTGILHVGQPATKPMFRPENRPVERRWYWLDRDALAATLDLPDLAPVTLVRTPDAPETTPPIAVQPVLALSNNHFGYAITWYGLGAALVAVYIAFGLARGRAMENPS